MEKCRGILERVKKQMDIIRSYKDIFGDSDAEIVRSMVTNWLIQKRDSKAGGKEK